MIEICLNNKLAEQTPEPGKGKCWLITILLGKKQEWKEWLNLSADLRK